MSHPLSKKQLEVLKAKYKNNMRKFNEEQMKLLKAEGATPPLGGCLLMFLQLPVWVSLYQILRTSIELRQAPFALWVHDLSKPDHLMPLPFIGTLNLLPLLMCAAQVIQMRLQPPPEVETTPPAAVRDRPVAAHLARGRTFALSVGRPVRFDLFASDDASASAGDLVDVDDDRFVRLPPLATRLERAEHGEGREVRVMIEGELSPVGTVDLACLEVDADPSPEAGSIRPPTGARRFRLAFQLRPGSMTSRPPPASSKSPRRLDPALELVERAFGKPRPDATGREAKDLLRQLERVLGERAQWTMEANRALLDALLPGSRARRRSADHERMFWLLAGWCVRPGIGDALDPGRVSAIAPLLDERLAFPGEARGWQAFFIAWRRISGGLDEAAQTQLRDFVDPHLAPAEAGMKRPKKPALALDDALDMASSLERVTPRRRSDLGGWVLERTWTDRDPRLWAAIGRLGARVPAYASVHHVVAPLVAERWIDHLLREKWDTVPTAIPAAVALARKTGDRARDVSDRTAKDVEKRLVTLGARPDQVRAVREVVSVDASERAEFFGDALPVGLRLVD